jgi:hypothetical protein
MGVALAWLLGLICGVLWLERFGKALSLPWVGGVGTFWGHFFGNTQIVGALHLHDRGSLCAWDSEWPVVCANMWWQAPIHILSCGHGAHFLVFLGTQVPPPL